MTIKELFTTYWSQFTLILISIGSLAFYFIKRHFDKSSKKIEINHSLFQQNTLKTVNDFFNNYARAETMWDQIEIWEILDKRLNAKEVDKIIMPVLNDLAKTVFELKIYFKNDDHKDFDSMMDGIYSINSKLTELYFSDDNGKKSVDKFNDFDSHKRNVLKKNSKLIDNVCTMIGNSFKN